MFVLLVLLDKQNKQKKKGYKKYTPDVQTQHTSMRN